MKEHIALIKTTQSFNRVLISWACRAVDGADIIFLFEHGRSFSISSPFFSFIKLFYFHELRIH